MKKLILIAALSLFIMNNSQAQGVTFAPEIGINLSSQTLKMNGTTLGETIMKPGFKIGGVANIPVASEFYIQPGIFFTTKGGEQEVSILGLTTNTTTHVNYIEIPINALYRFSFDHAGALFISAGPYAGYAVNGETRTVAPFIGKVKSDIDFGNNQNDEMKRFDFGLNAGIGYETPWGIYVRGQYGFGLINISPEEETNLKNQNIQISLGYNIGR